ncbi:hypothetical protein FQR65_LT19090 [Abscondita terminalis]|nr:hypothetical protein FQR65_LT19090 [Abscondita terminalis]
MEANNYLTCSATLEWLNDLGTVHRKVTYKEAALRLIKDEFKDMYLEISSAKLTSFKFKLKGINVHNKFMKDGKASIKFPEQKCTSKRDVTYNIVKEAIRMGYRHIDCASFYGNEREIGKAINECLNDHSLGLEREDLYISSKLWNTKHRPACVKAAYNKSLKDLCLCYLDLYLMHWPMAYQEGDRLVPSDPRGKVIFSSVSYLETWKAMEDLIKNKMVKSIGVCNFNKRQIQKLIDQATIKPVINQSFRIARQALAKKNEKPMLQCDTLLNLSEKHKKSPAQIALRYQIQRNNIVIPKTVNKKRLIENASIFDFTLAKEEMDLIDNIDVKRRYIALRAVDKHPDYLTPEAVARPAQPFGAWRTRAWRGGPAGPAAAGPGRPPSSGAGAATARRVESATGDNGDNGSTEGYGIDRLRRRQARAARLAAVRSPRHARQGEAVHAPHARSIAAQPMAGGLVARWLPWPSR